MHFSSLYNDSFQINQLEPDCSFLTFQLYPLKMLQYIIIHLGMQEGVMSGNCGSNTSVAHGPLWWSWGQVRPIITPLKWAETADQLLLHLLNLTDIKNCNMDI